MVAIWAAFTSSVQDPDYWWHYRVGRWMLDNGRLPSTDLFTYTATGHAWIDHEYLSEVLIALLQGWGGLAAVSLFFGALTWAGFWLIYKTAGAGRRPYVIAGTKGMCPSHGKASVPTPERRAVNQLQRL